MSFPVSADEFVVTPILRLDSLCIGQITLLISGSEVLRLMSTGSTLLRTRIAQGMQSFGGTFKSSGFVDANAHLRTLTPFYNLLSLRLNTRFPRQRVQTPIDWDLLPSKLTALNLKFAGCIEEFLNSGYLSASLGELCHLSLEDANPNFSIKVNATLDFTKLPRQLHTLSIRTNRRLCIAQPTLEGLPTDLEALTLYAGCAPVGHTNAGDSLLLPIQLPPNLRALEILGSSDLSWSIEMCKLPTSLEVFKLHNPAHLLPLAHPPRFGCTIDIKGIQRLTSLREFSVPGLKFPVARLHELPRLEVLDIPLFLDERNESLQDIFGENCAVCLRALKQFSVNRSSQTLPLDLSSFNNITTLQTSLATVDPNMLLPNSITSIATNQLPTGFIPNFIHHMPTSLQTFYCFTSPPASALAIARGLPPSVTSLEMEFNSKAMECIFARCEDGTLPSLRRLSLTGCSNLFRVPKQLSSLTIFLQQRGSLAVPEFYDSLRDSEVVELRLNYYVTSGRRIADDPTASDETMMNGFPILFESGLPRNLRSLAIAGSCAPGDVVNWPPSLTHLEYGVERPMGKQFSEYGASFLASLPPGMISLEIKLWEVDVTLDSLPLSCIPPMLSHFKTELRVGRAGDQSTVCDAYAAKINSLYQVLNKWPRTENSNLSY